MNFQQTYLDTAVIGKQFEVSWFHLYHVAMQFEQNKENRGFAANIAKPRHRMPLLRRNLEYIRLLKRGYLQGNRRRSKRKMVCGNKRKADSIDLLQQCFKHTTKVYNAAFRAGRKKKRAKLMIDSSDTESDNATTMTSSSPSPEGAIHELPATAASVARKRSINEISSQLDDDGVNCAVQARPNTASKIAYFPELIPLPPLEQIADLKTLLRSNNRVFFHYLFVGSGSTQPSACTERRYDRHCPFCNQNAETDFGLLAHLTTIHGTSLKFQAAKTEDGTLHIVARQQKDKMAGKHGLPPDFVFVSGKSRNIGMVPFVERPLETVATLPLVTRRSKIRELQACGADDATIGRYVPNDQAPIRQYYRSKTNQPMLDGDWEIDSDDESDPWVHKISEALIDEFVSDDVSSSEKHFMSIWNRFIKSHSTISDRSISQRCNIFVRQCAAELKRLNLRDDFHLHLMNLWDSGVVSSETIAHCMAEYDAAMTSVMDSSS